jgi:hypothetical protein
MTVHKFISGLSWRQIFIHLVAAWFFMHSFQTLVFLFNTKLVDVVRQCDRQNILNALDNSSTSTSDFLQFGLWPSFGRTTGLLVAFIISLTISIKRHWFWANSVIVLVAAYLLGWFHLLGWQVLKNIFLAPGQVFKNTTLEFLSNGIILLGLGLLAFFSGLTNEFVSKQPLSTTRSH